MKNSLVPSRVFIGVLTTSAALSAMAIPIAPVGTEGIAVISSGPPSAFVDAKYEGNTASFSNDLYLELDNLGRPAMDGNQANDFFIFNNQSSPVGSVVSLGGFEGGLELIFRLHVRNTGLDFYSGDASRNPDGLAHARVQGNYAPNVTLVSFEDLLGVPEGAQGYNDLSFTFSNTRATPVPEAGSTLAMLGCGLALIGFLRGKSRK